jgi:cobalt-zinc-cadmium efflux system protein
MDHPGDSEHRSQNKKRLRITLILSVTYMVAEFVGGILTNSLALLADAGHMLADAGALGLSLFALWAAQKPVTSTHTYGYFGTHRAACSLLLLEAAQRGGCGSDGGHPGPY